MHPCISSTGAISISKCISDIGPEQAGIALATGANTVSGLPQLSLTTGGVGQLHQQDNQQ